MLGEPAPVLSSGPALWGGVHRKFITPPEIVAGTPYLPAGRDLGVERKGLGADRVGAGCQPAKRDFPCDAVAGRPFRLITFLSGAARSGRRAVWARIADKHAVEHDAD